MGPGIVVPVSNPRSATVPGPIPTRAFPSLKSQLPRRSPWPQLPSAPALPPFRGLLALFVPSPIFAQSLSLILSSLLHQPKSLDLYRQLTSSLKPLYLVKTHLSLLGMRRKLVGKLSVLETSGKYAKIFSWRKMPLCLERFLQEPLSETRDGWS